MIGIGGGYSKFKLHNNHIFWVVDILVGPEILLFGSLVDHSNSEPAAVVPISIDANTLLAIHIPQRPLASNCHREYD